MYTLSLMFLYDNHIVSQIIVHDVLVRQLRCWKWSLQRLEHNAKRDLLHAHEAAIAVNAGAMK